MLNSPLFFHMLIVMQHHWAVLIEVYYTSLLNILLCVLRN